MPVDGRTRGSLTVVVVMAVKRVHVSGARVPERVFRGVFIRKINECVEGFSATHSTSCFRLVFVCFLRQVGCYFAPVFGFLFVQAAPHMGTCQGVPVGECGRRGVLKIMAVKQGILGDFFIGGADGEQGFFWTLLL